MLDEMHPSVVTLQPRSLEQEQEYRYAHLLPTFSSDRYPPLVPYDHVDPGQRALSHSNPHAFLDGAKSISEITPRFGTEVIGMNLAELDSTGRDQVALEVGIPPFLRTSVSYF
jgi:sulfonate dioxygenase